MAVSTTPRTGLVFVLVVAISAFALRLTVLAPQQGPASPVPAGTSKGRTAPPPSAPEAAACPAARHRDTGATGLTPEAIPTLPPDFSFHQVAADGCSPVRWNPCQPVHFVINRADAPPTGVADVREAFRRLARATGMIFVDDGLTDEVGEDNRAYQPRRYGERWAPILVHWVPPVPGREDGQIVGGGLPTRVGDVYVTASLFLNPVAVTNTRTRTTVSGGFGPEHARGAIGPEGVSWGRVILHELAHITGLGHVRAPSQLMYPETTEQTGPTGFQDGDLDGIRFLGREAGCLVPPPPGAR